MQRYHRIGIHRIEDLIGIEFAIDQGEVGKPKGQSKGEEGL